MLPHSTYHAKPFPTSSCHLCSFVAMTAHCLTSSRAAYAISMRWWYTRPPQPSSICQAAVPKSWPQLCQVIGHSFTQPHTLCLLGARSWARGQGRKKMPSHRPQSNVKKRNQYLVSTALCQALYYGLSCVLHFGDGVLLVIS